MRLSESSLSDATEVHVCSAAWVVSAPAAAMVSFIRASSVISPLTRWVFSLTSLLAAVCSTHGRMMWDGVMVWDGVGPS